MCRYIGLLPTEMATTKAQMCLRDSLSCWGLYVGGDEEWTKWRLANPGLSLISYFPFLLAIYTLESVRFSFVVLRITTWILSSIHLFFITDDHEALY
jgi:hypothetical protein